MLNETALKARIFKVHSAQTAKAKPKRWKTGAKAGLVRRAGLACLPYTKEQLWDHAVASVGLGGTVCPYCKQWGRQNIITLENLVFDHRVALKRGGEWAISNLVACCEDCNRLKGEMSLALFLNLMNELRSLSGPDGISDAAYIMRCLRTNGQAQQFQRQARPGAAVSAPGSP